MPERSRKRPGQRKLNEEEETRIISIRLMESQYQWLKSQGQMGPVIRGLIDKDMKKEEER